MGGIQFRLFAPLKYSKFLSIEVNICGRSVLVIGKNDKYSPFEITLVCQEIYELPIWFWNLQFVPFPWL